VSLALRHLGVEAEELFEMRQVPLLPVESGLPLLTPHFPNEWLAAEAQRPLRRQQREASTSRRSEKEGHPTPKPFSRKQR
jgi:hypothetical protein